MTCALKSRLQFLFSKWIKVNILCQAALYANLLRAPTLLPSRRNENFYGSRTFVLPHCHLQIHVQIKFPEPTELGLKFLQSDNEQTFYVYPESDMLLSASECKFYSSFSEWGKGWADSEIHRQGLERRQSHKKL
ncbi:hypothetical protein Patl1_22539 [Pistacia atlantica]|uniref:Uncharacterized protein n=1 Tax=Pistacia atlantica TaxID=434234 RepID=A0ACC1A1S2_9ROSI|nr:hypothetical protein Patl1_22539 [Pistacia atlantica]